MFTSQEGGSIQSPSLLQAADRSRLQYHIGVLDIGYGGFVGVPRVDMKMYIIRIYNYAIVAYLMPR